MKPLKQTRNETEYPPAVKWWKHLNQSNKMKTPMQEMYDQLKASRKDEYGLAFAIDMLLENEEVMLQKEKEVIENAYWDGGQWVPTSGSQCEEYYNETFNTKEK